MANTDYVWATGRRKEASAQVRLRPGTGKVTINERTFQDFFPTESLRGYIVQPFLVTNTLDKFDVVVTVRGGGQMGQAGAVRHGITRTLMAHDSALRTVLKDSGMVTRDSRVKERKKSGQPGARKRFQFSKR